MKSITTRQNTLQIALTLFMAASLACVAVGARADESVNGMAVRKVQFSDLRLDTQTGAAILYRRIHTAAIAVCGDVDSRRLEEAAAAQACVERAMNTSVSAINAPQLTSVYRAHFGVVTQQSIKVASVH